MARRASLATTALFALALGAAAPIAADEPAPAVRRLAEALRFETVSHQDRGRIDTAAFAAFRAFLRRSYPRAFATLEVETVSGHSLLLRWPGTNADAAPVLLDAHYDVVPIEPGTEDDWTHPPFSGAIADGYVWGRGALDDKVGVMVTFEALEALVASGFAPERTLYFSFVHDEEIGGAEGAAVIARTLRDRGVRCAYAIGEGGGFVSGFPLLPQHRVGLVALAEKSYVTLTLRATGAGGHSSTPPRDSSIVRLAKALVALHENPFEARLAPPVDEMLRVVGEHTGGLTGWALRNQWASRPLLLSRLASDPVGSAMVRTTTAVTMVDAGVKENVVPQRAEARVNFRLLPDERAEDLVEDVRALVDDPRIEVTASTWGEGPGIADPDGEGFARIRSAIEAVEPETIVLPGLLMATTDSRHYAAIADDVYRFHPMSVSAEDARSVHGTNERIPVEAVEQGVLVFRELIRGVARPE